MDFGDFCRQLLDKTDIVRVVSKYVKLTKMGNDYVAPCPFHPESKPSFRVRGDKQYYHCFGCHKGGDAIQFLSEIERIDRIDAIKILADEANMELPSFSGSRKAIDKEKRFKLYSLMKEAAKRYNENLASAEAEIAMRYIKKRNIPENLVTRFGLGYSIPSDIIKYLKSKGFSIEEMKEAGLVSQRASGWYDVFSERLIFPIINNTGEVVAFGGRALKDEDFPKYRNSSQTEIFDKSRTVYALNLLKKKKLKGGSIDYIIMCEGYMDVIALHKAGFDTAVASMGTSLTTNQARQIKNYTNKVIISYDGDGAGQKATLRGLDILRESGLTVKVAKLPEGLDPDDVINKFGEQGYLNCLNSANTLTGFKLDSIKAKYDLTDPDGKSKYALEAVACVKQLGNPVEIEEYLNVVQQNTGYSMDILKMQADLVSKDEPVKPSEPAAIAVDPSDKDAEFILASLLAGASYAYVEDDMYELMPEGFFREVMKSVIDSRLKGIKDPMQFIYSDIDENYYPNLSPIVEYKFIDGDDKSKFDDCVKSLKYAAIDKRIKDLTREYDADKEKKDLLGEIVKLSKQLKQLKHGG